MKELIYKHALKNALKYGKADSKVVLSKVLAEAPELKLKKKAAELLPLIEEIVREVNSFPAEKIAAEIKKFEFPEKKEKRREWGALPELKNPVNVKLRFAPNPNGPLHLGHARAAILNDEYAKKYNGKLILRLEDTDPARVDPKAYEMIEEELEWLGVEIHEKVVQSERLEIYYEHAKKLIEKGAAYVCTCNPAEFQRLRVAKKACDCRKKTVQENLERFSKMFSEYKEGTAALRLKTDLALPDPSMRDYPILRITDEPHPKVRNKRVYPLMNFSVAVDDHLLGITHVLRGKDHIANTEKQKFIYNYFLWRQPEFIHYGLLKIEDLELSTSGMAKGIKEGIYSGWDDVKLGTLRALQKRGIKPGAIRRAMLDIGIKDTDISFSWKNLYAYNKELIEPEANRYFFVHSPKELIIENCIDKTVYAPLHPDFPERGKRKLEIKTKNRKVKLYISGSDFQTIKAGEFVRLMDAFNIEILRKTENTVIAKFRSEAMEEARERKAKFIHWVPEDNICVKVIAPENIFEGFGEKKLKTINPGEMLQFERFGFVRIESTDERLIAYFAHK